MSQELFSRLGAPVTKARGLLVGQVWVEREQGAKDDTWVSGWMKSLARLGWAAGKAGSEGRY